MDVFVARQPILNDRKELHAYELLFRSSMKNIYSAVDGDRATADVITNTFLHIGKEDISSDRPAFINFTRDLLLKGVPLLLPKGDIVVEVLEDVEPSPEVVRACREVVEAGYTLALDDFVYSDEYLPLIDLAHIIKLDLRVSSRDELRSYVDTLAGRDLRFLAEKVEDAEEFEFARSLGCTLFQGYFFSKPEVMKGLGTGEGRSLSALSLVSELNRPDFEFDRVRQLVRADVNIAYKLLRYINSATFARANEITSVEEAVVLLGATNLRRFLSIILLTEMGEAKPQELLKTSVQRARFCELLDPSRGEELFTLGLFSLLDALLDAPMEEILERLPLSDPLAEALRTRRGPLAAYLGLVIAYQRGQWPRVGALARRLRIPEERLPQAYGEALAWADATFDGV